MGQSKTESSTVSNKMSKEKEQNLEVAEAVVPNEPKSPLTPPYRYKFGGFASDHSLPSLPFDTNFNETKREQTRSCTFEKTLVDISEVSNVSDFDDDADSINGKEGDLSPRDSIIFNV